MKWWTWAAAFVVVGMLAACSSSDSTSGSGGEGGEPATGPGPASGTGATGGAGGTGGGATCDAIGVCQTPQDPNANTCAKCALAGDCADEAAACMADMGCTQFVQCYGACMGDQTCINNCAAMDMAAYDLYAQINLCVVCGNCKMSCPMLAMELMCP